MSLKYIASKKYSRHVQSIYRVTTSEGAHYFIGAPGTGHIRQVVVKYMFNQYEMYCEEILKLRSHNTSYCLIEVVT
jgi:gamma-glutamyltranspeptidase